MNDSISRQAAIDTARRLHDVAWENWEETKISANTMIDALKDLPAAQPEQRWIPCSERLPEEMTYVLVTDKDGDVYSVKFIEVIDGQAEWVFDNGIIAWMPLPEPYDPLTGHMNEPEE